MFDSEHFRKHFRLFFIQAKNVAKSLNHGMYIWAFWRPSTCSMTIIKIFSTHISYITYLLSYVHINILNTGISMILCTVLPMQYIFLIFIFVFPTQTTFSQGTEHKRIRLHFVFTLTTDTGYTFTIHLQIFSFLHKDVLR